MQKCYGLLLHAEFLWTFSLIICAMLSDVNLDYLT